MPPEIGAFQPEAVAALVVAAGRGSRFGGPLPKQYAPLLGRPILRHTLDALLRAGLARVQVVISPEDARHYEAAAAGLGLPAAVAGGETRQESVRRGLEALAAGALQAVLIHDGARPLVDAATVGRVLAALRTADGAVAAVPAVDSLLRVEAGRAGPYLDRTGVYRAQTPQGFRFAAIREAHRRFAGAGMGDDVQVARAAGLEVTVVEGAEDNLKVTAPADLARAEGLLLARLGDVRVGQGYDVHRLGPGSGVMLCGVAVPHERSLVGHSDADVALHALTDAILGALGEADIGRHFPPGDPRWRGASSDRFLAHAMRLLAARGGVLAHADLTVVCEAPRIGPHREAMRARLAELLQVGLDRVSVKATTTERLGFAGRREGIACQAVATVRLPV